MKPFFVLVDIYVAKDIRLRLSVTVMGIVINKLALQSFEE
ncbi:hypothetical protein ECAE60S_03936 [Eoetvoesiella caeni]